jgi:Protein of unknown function (DUF2938)
MAEVQEYVLSAVVIGAGATAIMDLWAVARKRLRGVASADYGLVGRWLGHMLKGRFRHHSISAASPMPGERLIGWTAHYLVGIAFAFVLLTTWGMDWVDRPTIGPALIVGIGSVAAPFLFMQPGMGAGVAASRTPNPTAARLRSLTTHAVFGLGLYAAAGLLSLVRG